MVFLHFPSGHTDEEMMLRAKYAKLRKKKKALQAFQNPKPEPEKVNPLKRPLEPKDAKEYAKKLVLSGKITVPLKGVTQKTLFKKPQGLARKLSETRAVVAPTPNPHGGTFQSPSSVTGVSSGALQYKPYTPPPSSILEPSSASPSTSSSSYGMAERKISRVGPMMKPRKYATGLVGDDGPDEGGSSSNPIPGPSHGRGFSIPKKPFGRGAPSTTDYKPKQGNTVHVKAKGITEEKCREAFQNIGSILNISMELERNCGFVTFSTVASAEKAIQEVNGNYIGNTHLEVSFAFRQPPVTEIINDASAAPAWAAIAQNQSQKATHKDKRDQLVYDDII